MLLFQSYRKKKNAKKKRGGAKSKTREWGIDERNQKSEISVYRPIQTSVPLTNSELILN